MIWLRIQRLLKWIKLKKDSIVYHNELIRTGSGGGAKITLVDGTIFTLGQNTILELDEFVYRTEKSTPNEFSARLTKGVFRYITGKIARKKLMNFQLRVINSGSIGIRGTDFIASYVDDKASLQLYEGEVEITTEAGADIITAGKAITFDKTGITSEKELTEEEWQSAVKGLEVNSPNWLMVLIVLLLLFTIVGLTAFFVKKYTKPKTKAWGITSLIFGIFSIILSITAIFGLPFAIGAIWVSRIQKKQNPTKLATAGLILGIIGIILGLIITSFSLLVVVMVT